MKYHNHRLQTNTRYREEEPLNTNRKTITVKLSKGAKNRNRYNQVQHLTQNTNKKVTNSKLVTTNESQEVSPFPAGDHKAHINRRSQRHSKHKTEKNKRSTKEVPPRNSFISTNRQIWRSSGVIPFWAISVCRANLDLFCDGDGLDQSYQKHRLIRTSIANLKETLSLVNLKAHY